MKVIVRNLLVGAALAAGATAQAAGSPDIVILPSAPSAWRTVVGQWGSMVELNSDNVDVPPPSDDSNRSVMIGASARSSEGLRQSVQLRWKDRWLATARFESREPMDLRPYMDGALTFDLEVDDLAKGGVAAKLSCGDWCERSVNLIELARVWAGKGVHTVSLPMSCFMRDGADFSRVRLPFAVDGSGSGSVRVSNARITAKPTTKPSLNCPDYRTETVTGTVQIESFAIDWWRGLHEQQLEEKRRMIAAGTPPQLVFIGDSITQNWKEQGQSVWKQYYAPLHALNLGIGGDRTENVLWRLEHGALDGLAPKVVVMMIGTNNSGVQSPERTAAGVKRLLDEIQKRLPTSKVLLLAIFPRGEKPDDFLRGVNDRVNAIISGYADGKRVHFLNINSAMLDANGVLSRALMPDLLHPDPKGYEIWQREIAPALKELMGTSP